MKNGRWFFIAIMLFSALVMGAALFSTIQEADWPRIRELDLPQMLASGEIIAVPLLLIVTGIVLSVLFHFYRIVFPPAIKNGVTAQARVLKVWDTGTTINDDPQIGLLLEVAPSLGAVFQAEAKTLVSRLNAALVQPGITAQVIYDPNQPKRIQVKELNVEGAASPKNAAARMEELEELRSRRLITEEEYQAKRRKILDRI
jgi:hypothetical protein